MDNLLGYANIEVAVLPVDTTGAAAPGDYVNLAHYGHVSIVINQGAWAGGTAAVTLVQASDNAATGVKALAFTKRYEKEAFTEVAFEEIAVVANTFNLSEADHVNVIEIDSDTLDLANGFTHLSLQIASPGANADLVSAMYYLSAPRFATLPPVVATD